MASPEVLSRLEQRAIQAEQMIDLLTKQIAQLQAVAVHTHKEKLRQENQELRLEVDRLKKCLLNLEKAQGITQYYDFSKKTTSSSPASDPQVQFVPLSSNLASAQPQPPIEKGNKEKGDKKSEKKEKEKVGGEKKGGKKPEDEAPVDVSRLDFRVGKIVSAKKHPDADSLYVEEVDVGEEKMRTVVSGLVKFIPVEELQNRMAVLLCNLKPVKMRGITSEAMVMCASTPEKVEVLAPPEGSQPGDLVEFEGYTRNPDAVLNPKKKVFETCAPDLKVDTNKVAVYKGIPFNVPGKGVVVSQTLLNVQVK
ncbi:aminoacyl tRNA synthase complex-interacting multifunctional protein 1 [Panulirus ornatus]|uniref:aminoacyl tRNA synthase complex-interacting multifunctional protein 1 n=1 Tax=Panulirus ornatus TaxID=150431 RepID=UPI003A88D6BF